MKKFAAFDIDGTIFRWQLYHELYDELYRLGHIDQQVVAPVIAARDNWQNRQSSFGDYEEALVRSMEASLIGLPESALIQAASTIIDSRGSHVYLYTTDLLQKLKSQGYTILAISGSQQQVVERFAALYDIDIAYGRRHEVTDGIFTGAGQPIYGQKAQILTRLVEQHQLDWADSYAIGDTDSDGDMMELVANPIAFNPDQKLYDRARKEGWKIVVERKNIIYELSNNGNSFVLA